MQKVLTIFIIVFLASQGGCKKKSNQLKDEIQPPTTTEEPRATRGFNNQSLLTGHAALKWNASASNNIYSTNGVERELKNTDNNVLTATKTITIPAKVPSLLNFNIKAPCLADNNESVFVKAFINTQGNTVDLISNSLKTREHENGDCEYEFNLTGFDIAFSRNKEQQGELEIEIFEAANKKLFTVSLALCTPPSEIAIETIHANDFNPEVEGLPAGVKYVSVDSKMQPGTKIAGSLLRVLRIENKSKDQLDISIPTINIGRVWTAYNHRQAQDTFCDGAGYRILESSSHEDFTDNIVLLPLTQDVLNVFSVLTNTDQVPQIQTIKLKPDEVAFIGIYGIGEKIEKVMKNGPLRKGFLPEQVDTNCYRGDCSRREERCHGSREGTNCQDLCVDWEVRRNNMIVRTGMETTPTLLDIFDTKRTIMARFAGINAKDDPEGRTIPVFDERYTQFE